MYMRLELICTNKTKKFPLNTNSEFVRFASIAKNGVNSR